MVKTCRKEEGPQVAPSNQCGIRPRQAHCAVGHWQGRCGVEDVDGGVVTEVVPGRVAKPVEDEVVVAVEGTGGGRGRQ